MECLDVYFIQLLLLTVGVIYLLWMKSLWEDLEEDNTVFYPDGLEKCPQETYTIDDDGSSVKCISCPTCPTGEEPSPPCGSTLVRKLSGECLPCKTGTFSDKADSASCKVCTDCGSRGVARSCTAERNTECRKCPWRHYEDDSTHICKHCSFCCEKHSAAQMKCMKSKTCKGNCSQPIRVDEKYLSPMLNKLVAKVKNSSYNTDSVLNPTKRQKVTQDMPERLKTAIDTDSKESNTEREKRDVHLSVASLDDYKDTSDRKTTNVMSDSPIEDDIDGKETDDWLLLQIPDSSNDEQKTADLPRMEQEKESYNTNGVIMKDQLVSAMFQPVVPPPPTPDANIRFVPPTPENPEASKIINGDGALMANQVASTTLQPTVPTPKAPFSNIGQLLLPTPNPVKTTTKSTAATEPSPVINPNLFLSSFSGTLAAFLLVGFIVVIIYFVHRKCVHKMARGYRKTSETDLLREEQITDDQLGENRKEDEMESLTNRTTEICDQNDATQIEEDLNLSEIPQDLEDILVMRLDVPHGRPESKVYAWEKVGNATGISRHELKLFQNEYLRQNGSPTKLLLEKLGSQGKTISYLLDVLQTPRVQLGSVAASIRHRVTRI